MPKINPREDLPGAAWKAGSPISMVASMVKGWSDYFNTGGVEEIHIKNFNPLRG